MYGYNEDINVLSMTISKESFLFQRNIPITEALAFKQYLNLYLDIDLSSDQKMRTFENMYQFEYHLSSFRKT